MNRSASFPHLTLDTHRETSPQTPSYNCIAWAAEDVDHWWQEGGDWRPEDWPADDCGLGSLERLFRTLGYHDCGLDASHEPTWAKVALYAKGSFEWTHAARQLPSGKWTSKLGKGIDIEHDTPEVVAGGLYGEVMQVMKRGGAPVDAGP